MCKKIVLFLVTLLCYAVSADAADKTFTLVIDAGHGGKDAGAIGSFSKEKNLTLKYALAFGRMVEQNCPDVKVVYTRKTDYFVELYRRAEIANRNKADLFISIHINALPNGRIARGFQTYTLGRSRSTGKTNGVMQNLEVAKRENSVILLEKDYKQTYQGYDPNSPESNIMFEFIQDKNMENSVELAKYMQRYVCQATGRQDMGAQQDNLAVLRLSSMPGCLIELGFISTRDEEEFLNSKEAEGMYARGIYNAFLAYRKKHGGSVTIPFQPVPAQEEMSIPQIVPRKAEASAPSVTPVTQTAPVVQEVKVTDSVPDSVSLKPVKESRQTVEAKSTTNVQSSETADMPIFKVQILVSSAKIKANDARMKGLTGVDCYQEGGLYKYTVGSSQNYQEILRLRKEVHEKFPEAFVVAFRNGKRMNVNDAVRAYNSKK